MRDATVAPEDRGLVIASLLGGSWRLEPGVASISEDQLELVTPILIRSGTAGLAWRRIRNTRLGSTLAGRQLQHARRIQAAEAAIRANQIERVLTIDGVRGARPILVKGWANGRSYPEEGLRQYTDIDLIVRPDRFEAVVAAAGCLIPLDPDHAVQLDIQRNLRDVPDRSWEQLEAHSRVVPIGNGQVTVLGDEDTLRLACLHLLHHSGFHPVWLCDVGALAESLEPDFDWDYCLSGQPHRTKWMLAVIRLANQLLGASLVRCPPIRPRAVPAWMFKLVLGYWGAGATFQYPSPHPGSTRAIQGTRPRRLSEIVANNWPDPLQAVGRLGWPISRLSGRAAQVAYFTARPIYRAVHHRAGLLRPFAP